MPVSAPHVFYTLARYSHHTCTVRVSVSRVLECSGHRQPDARGDLRRLLLRDAAPPPAVLQLPRLRPVRAPLDALAHVCARLPARASSCRSSGRARRCPPQRAWTAGSAWKCCGSKHTARVGASREPSDARWSPLETYSVVSVPPEAREAAIRARGPWCVEPLQHQWSVVAPILYRTRGRKTGPC